MKFFNDVHEAKEAYGTQGQHKSLPKKGPTQFVNSV